MVYRAPQYWVLFLISFKINLPKKKQKMIIKTVAVQILVIITSKKTINNVIKKINKTLPCPLTNLKMILKIKIFAQQRNIKDWKKIINFYMKMNVIVLIKIMKYCRF